MKAKNTFTIHTELMDETLPGVRNIYMGQTLLVTSTLFHVIKLMQPTIQQTQQVNLLFIFCQVIPSFKSVASRQSFIDEHCKTGNGQISLQHDVPMGSPSGASGIILGRPSNGWDDWKNADGNKIGNAIERQE